MNCTTCRNMEGADCRLGYPLDIRELADWCFGWRQKERPEPIMPLED